MSISIEPFQVKYWPDVCEVLKNEFQYPDDYNFELNYRHMFEYEWDKE